MTLAESPSDDAMETLIGFAGRSLVADPAGALFCRDTRLLVVADLHLEKGSSFARRGQLLPPYDSHATLDRLLALARRRMPHTIVLLGDSFHDRGGAERLDPGCHAMLGALAARHRLIWISGNHDPALPAALPGERAEAITLAGLHLRHQPDGAPREGEVVGHFHPVARVGSPRGAVRRRCFLADGRRIILPAFGSLAGGLNVRDPAIAGLSGARERMAYVLGERRVFAVRESRLLPDRTR